MNSILYSWLSAAAVAPFVALLSSWTLVVFRSYRRDWRLLDIFLFALTSLEVASALFGFGYAVLGVIRPALEAPCRFILWGLAATRIFHLATVTSLLLDRALAAKWPKAYRSSVRHSQVRYHIVVLAVVSVFVGVTSVFARLPSSTCTLRPSEWDLKFSGFLACVHVFLLVTGIVCCLSVQIGRFKVNGFYRTSWSRDSATSSSSASCSETRDLEWGVVSSVCWLSYLLNHTPFLVLTILGLFIPTFWSPWVDNAIIWLRLAQGLLVPWMILIADLPHRSALRNMLRQPGTSHKGAPPPACFACLPPSFATFNG
ncbi:uncharacterized protein LOC129226312 [Uloborus diversus]|uniref:uncharacterized protein LOC129226312 n=1 Tax=Uloborus diversus TaxID=327109 RepID=UPI0024097B38|nr:uncharacterized protein LOC129226312 [Uloborus diversus]